MDSIVRRDPLHQRRSRLGPDDLLDPGYVQAMAAHYRAVSIEDAVAWAKSISRAGKLSYRREVDMYTGEAGRTQSTDGLKYLDVDGRLHRDGGPACVGANGTQMWCRNGNLHREDGPAYLGPEGEQGWYYNGMGHREDGPAVVSADGTQQWYRHGKLHREDGPALIIADGTQQWSQEGRQHREDGPAAIHPDGRVEWFWRDEPMSEKAILLRSDHEFTEAELAALALSDDEAEREGALNHPACPEHVRVFASIAS